jgi:hypothetical protein
VPAGSDLLDLKIGYGSAVTKIALEAELYASDGVTAVSGGQLVDDKPTDGTSNLATTVRAAPGSYLLSVRDVGDQNRDDVNTYTLIATGAKDPDTHEPNDTKAQAKTADALPSWFAYAGDVDMFKVTMTAALPLLLIQIASGSSSKALVIYSLQDANGKEIATGSAAPGTTLVEQRAIITAGDYYLVLTQEAKHTPDRATNSSYTLTLSAKPEPDPNEGPLRNDTGATATCLGATGTTGCPSGFNGSADIMLATKTGRISTTGDRDFYRLDVAAGTPAIVEINASQPTPAPTQLSFDLLVPEPNSPCTSNADCDSLNIDCNGDNDCELSHTCLPLGSYHFCPAGQLCQRCVGGNACVPSGVGTATVCAAPQFLSQAPPTVANMSGTSTLHTAQPLFAPGPYFISVHDFQDNQYDDTRDYTLDVKVWRELDGGDSSATASARNNFYNPYPLQSQDHTVDKARAIDITATIKSPTGVTGYISYASDEDWYKFKYPCSDAMNKPVTCGIQFTWDQPASSKLRVVLLMRTSDLGIHESFVYTGTLDGNAHPGQIFGDLAASGGNCGQCSFANASDAGGDVNYDYYLQVRDVGADDWEVAQPYHFSISAISGISGTTGPTGGTGPPLGCPSACGYHAPDCFCYCPAQNACPPIAF